VPRAQQWRTMPHLAHPWHPAPLTARPVALPRGCFTLRVGEGWCGPPATASPSLAAHTSATHHHCWWPRPHHCTRRLAGSAHMYVWRAHGRGKWRGQAGACRQLLRGSTWHSTSTLRPACSPALLCGQREEKKVWSVRTYTRCKRMILGCCAASHQLHSQPAPYSRNGQSNTAQHCLAPARARGGGRGAWLPC
jgi:hypothetical protein